MKIQPLKLNLSTGIFPFVVLFLAIATISSTRAEAQDPFITTWEVTAGDLDITIPTNPGLTYNYDVDWGDTTSDTNVTGDATHTYSSAGTYTVEITGDFPQIYFYNGGSSSDAEKILTVEQWGDISWNSMGGAFWGATNLTINAPDAPDLSGVNSMWCMFCSASSMNSDLSAWDVSTVTGMSSMFAGASAFNGDISTWNVSNVTDISSMFLSAGAFNGDLSGWDVSSVTTMSFMFAQAAAFNGDISGWNVSDVTDMSSMFASATSFNQDISTKTINAGTSDEYEAWDVGNVTDMRQMFDNATAFNQDIGGWDVSGVTDISGMFDNATAFNQDIGGWNVSSVLDMGYTFLDATAFNQDISGWTVSNVTNMADMFAFASAFDQDLGGWDVSGVTDMTGMLDNSGLSTTNYDNTLIGWAGLPSLQNSVALGANGLEYCAETARQTLTDPPNSWTITGDALAGGCTSSTGFITTWKTDNPGTSNNDEITIPTFGLGYNYDVSWEDVTDATVNGTQAAVLGTLTITFPAAGTYAVEISGDFPRIYFDNAGDKEKIMSIEQWGDIAWTSMGRAFWGASNLEINATDAPDLSAVTSMSFMFSDASSMNSDLNAWDVSNVLRMDGLFSNASAFNQDISGWDVSAVTHMQFMFRGATAFNQDISGWNTANVTNMNAMFVLASSFNQDISGWNVANVTHMGGMFSRASLFNQNIGAWNVENVTDMRQMFENATAFNQNIGSWDVSAVTDMDRMFFDASAFDQDLGGWDVGNVTGMDQMLDLSGLSTANYDNTLIGWAGLPSLQSGVPFGADGLEYCNAGTERQMLIDAPNNWTINDDGLAAGCPVQRPFITTWKTDNSGTSNDYQITIPTFPGETYNYNVVWGDGNSDTGVTGDITHTYSPAGTYTVEITGDFPRIYFNDAGDKEKILTVEQWGDIAWTSMENAFRGASNLEINATDAPDLSGITSTVNMFNNASSMNSDLNHWDVSNVTDMSSMFAAAISFDGDISSWNTDNVTNMRDMFIFASAFNQDISTKILNAGTSDEYVAWNVSNVTDMELMFAASVFNQDISNWNVSNVTNMGDMFEAAGSFNQNLGGWDVSGVTDMSGMLAGSGLSTANYDATLIGWAGLPSLQNGIVLGADGLVYCNGETERQTLIDAPNNWTINGDALAAGCGAPTGTDQRILASNQSTYIFSGGDFGMTDPAYSVKIETLPGSGDLQFDGIPVSALDVISVADINDDKLTWDQSTDLHGYDYTSFDFRVVDGGGAESDPPNTLSIDLAAAAVELTGGEGWRFMTSPAIGETLGGFLNPVWSQGVAGSDNPGASFPNVYRIDQPNYVWDVPGHMSDPIGIGEAFIAFIYSDDNSDGTPDGFPKTLMSGETWNPLDGTFEFTGLDYDTGQGPEGDSHFLIANPHPVSLNFCEMYDVSTNIASSVDIWDPAANGGNGDYINLNCAAPENVHIAPFQGFWVRTTDVNPDLDVPEDAYLGSQANGYFKQPSKGSEPLEGLADKRSAMSQIDIADLARDENPFLVTLTLTSDDEVFTNKTNLLFSEQASAGLDEWDAPKLNPAGLANRWLSFYSLDDQNRAYAFQTIPDDFGEKVTIPLNVETTEAGRYNLNWSFPESHIFNGSFFLRDNVTGEVVELREGGRYSFEIEPDQTSKVSETLEVLGMERSAKSHKDFADLGEAAPRFELLVAQAGVDGMTELGAVPDQFELAQNYPNPFNPTTVISYQLPVNSEVRLEVYDMLGRRVASLVDSQVAAGRHTVNFDASGLSSGIYLYRLQAGSQIMTRKLTVVK